MERPTFLILGFPKCGTTAVASALTHHPDVALSRPKEPHFFDVHYDRGAPWYDRTAFAHVTSESAVGEATPSYLFVPWALPRIRSDLPMARFVVVLRNPLERTWSHWWMLRARGLETRPFEEAVTLSLEEQVSHRPVTESRWRDHTAAQSRGVAVHFHTYVDYSLFARHLERAFEILGRDAIHIELLEDIRANENAAMERILGHIGVDPARWPGTGIPAQNAALGEGGRRVLDVARRLGVTRLAPHLPDVLKTRFKSSLSRLGRGPRMSEEARAFLRPHLSADVDRLMELMGRDLSHWLA